MKRLASLFLAVLALVAIGVAEGALSINGAGATFPNPMYSKWFDDYHKKHSDLEINYQSIGSGGGIKQVTEGTVEVVPIPTAFDFKAKTLIPANLGIVIKASKLEEFAPMLEELDRKERELASKALEVKVLAPAK